MITRYKFVTKVVNVEERHRVVSTAKKPDGTTEEVTESLGWFVRLDQSSALHFGSIRPDMNKGDTVQMTIEKVEAPKPSQKSDDSEEGEGHA